MDRLLPGASRLVCKDFRLPTIGAAFHGNTAKQSVSALSSVGIDIGKTVFHIVGFDTDGKIVLGRKIKRLALIATFEKLPSCIVGVTNGS
jgi:hypothetical protein